MTFPLFRILTLVAFVLVAAGCNHNVNITSISRGDHAAFEKELDDFISGQMKKFDVPGVSVAVIVNQKIVMARGFGYADREKKIKASAETAYEIGSITKPFTALAALKLVEEGRLDPDRPVQDYLPGFSMKRIVSDAAPITPRALLSHHAGIPRYHLKGMISKIAHTVLDDGLDLDYVLYPQGKRFEYSNVGYALMWDVISSASGEPYVELVDREILRPLGMSGTSFSARDAMRPPQARGYSRGRPAPAASWRDGELYSNALDLGRFMQFLFSDGTINGRRILSRRALDAMFEPRFPDSPDDFGLRYGMGWFIGGVSAFSEHQVAWHNGRTPSAWARILLLRDRKIGIAVLTNSDSGRPLVYAATQKAVELLLQAEGGSVRRVRNETDDHSMAKPDEKALERLAGFYSYGGAFLQIYAKGGELGARIEDHDLTLVPAGQDSFRIEKKLLGFISISTGLPDIRIVRRGEDDYILLKDTDYRIGQKIPAHSVPESWKKRLGDYRIVNPDPETVINFRHIGLLIEEGFLLLNVDSDQPEGKGRLVLMPVSDDVSYIFGAGATGGPNGAVSVNMEGAATQLRYSGYVFERMQK